MRQPRHARWALAGLLAAVFLGMLDAQIVATAVPRVVADLGGLPLFSWITTGYVVAGCVTGPIYGRLGDRFGRKPVFLASITLFLIGSLLCGLAGSMGWLVAFQIVQGAGSGGLFVLVSALLGELFGPREAARYSGAFGIAFAVSALAGPPVGGVLTDVAGWRSVFLVNLPVGVLALALVAGGLRLPPRSVPVPGGAGLIPLRLFRDRTFTGCVLLSVVAGFVGLGLVNYAALFAQHVLGLDATGSGLLLLPMMLAVAFASVLSSRVVVRTGRYKWLLVTSMALFVVSATLLSTMDPGTKPVVAAVLLAIIGVAAGLNMQVLTVAAQNAVARADLGAASATVTVARQLGTALGGWVFGLVLTLALGHGADEATALDRVFGAALPVPLLGLATALCLHNIQLRSNR